MGYVIHYGDGVPDPFPVRTGRSGTVAALLLILGCLAAGRMFLPEQVREAVFPWTRDSVQAAFADFSADMRQGAPFRDAFEAFCREILDEAAA